MSRIARFAIRYRREDGRITGVVLHDRKSVAFLRTYGSLEAACRGMDNRVRIERGFPPRLDITTAEIRGAMTRRRDEHGAISPIFPRDFS